MNDKQNENKKMTLRERLKNKRERAKIELLIYGIFFIGAVIFIRVSSNYTSNIKEPNTETESFIFSIKDNYEYNTQLTINDKTYEYYGKVLGNNSTINLTDDEQVKSYYLMNKKYYILEEENYILTTEEEVYPYIDYRHLNIENIKTYIKLSTKENNVYKLKISDIILNSDSKEYLTITIEEGDKNIVIDYTPLFKIIDSNTEKVLVNITYTNVDKILSLEE